MRAWLGEITAWLFDGTKVDHGFELFWRTFTSICGLSLKRSIQLGENTYLLYVDMGKKQQVVFLLDPDLKIRATKGTFHKISRFSFKSRPVLGIKTKYRWISPLETESQGHYDASLTHQRKCCIMFDHVWSIVALLAFCRMLVFQVARKPHFPIPCWRPVQGGSGFNFGVCRRWRGRGLGVERWVKPVPWPTRKRFLL